MRFRNAGLLASALVLAVLYGRVNDLTTGQPLTGVTVSIGAHHTRTDADGKYRLSGLTPGSYTLTLHSNDVPPQHHHVRVGASAAGTKLDLRACSTTLDYGCASGMPGSPLGPGR